MDELYCRIYYRPSIDRLTVVEMDYHDERSYDEDLFMRNEIGELLSFDSESEAIQWLFDNVVREKINPDYIKYTVKYDRESFLK